MNILSFIIAIISLFLAWLAIILALYLSKHGFQKTEGFARGKNDFISRVIMYFIEKAKFDAVEESYEHEHLVTLGDISNDYLSSRNIYSRELVVTICPILTIFPYKYIYLFSTILMLMIPIFLAFILLEPDHSLFIVVPVFISAFVMICYLLPFMIDFVGRGLTSPININISGGRISVDCIDMLPEDNKRLKNIQINRNVEFKVITLKTDMPIRKLYKISGISLLINNEHNVIYSAPNLVTKRLNSGKLKDIVKSLNEELNSIRSSINTKVNA